MFMLESDSVSKKEQEFCLSGPYQTTVKTPDIVHRRSQRYH